ncbi:glycerol kinase GlpK [Ichthyobacterium seriolicida]|uniref:Glycerol kinase n=1 Tax=Ichthyobacterium seriolicida TaxID=242600 RepID=A0A1J1DYD9_9FLAO|nr:glycerol kinase GlpK [Ichthyobacterium seriolicida]BAV94914.1 glycerol kinase [Ichthyobacterium seriolicida]
MNKYILSLDQGTTSSRAIIFDKDGDIKHIKQQEYTQIFPQPGWVEHDADEIWSTQIDMAIQAVNEVGADNVSAIGITNQRETTVVWDRSTGKPVYNAIVWQDKRTLSFCNSLKEDGLEDMIRSKTGLIIDSYFSASKVKWILDNVDGRGKAENGDLLFGTIDCWLVWNLTKGKVHITDITNASRTMLFNVQTGEWDRELLDVFGIPDSMLPQVKECSEVYGETDIDIFSKRIPISGIAGDQQSALFGQMCVEKAMIKNTYGTGCFMLMNIGDKFIESKNNLLTTVAWKINGKTQYAFEGSVFIGGAVVQWIRDGLKFIEKSSEIEELSLGIKDNNEVYVVPSFVGLGAPYWEQRARGIVVGLTRGSTRRNVAHAALWSIAYQTMDVLNAMKTDANLDIKELRVDGGVTANNLLMQFQSNLLNCRIIKPKSIETTALGAAYLAGLAVGYWENLEEIQKLWKMEKEFNPDKNRSDVMKGVKGWRRAIHAAKAWASYEEEEEN